MHLEITAKPLDQVLAYQHDRLLERYAADHNASQEEAAQCFHAAKQFLYLCAVTPGYKVTSAPIDEMWHTFLLFTRDYDAFCREQLGQFIHHEPFEVPRPDVYLTTRARAEELFGKLDEKLWSLEAKTSCSSGCNGP